MNRHTPIPSSVSPLSAFARRVGRLLRPVASAWTALAHRREVRHLSELDDRTLRDTGLSRSEVDGALAEPLHRDPSLVLVRAIEKRAGIQAQPVFAKRERPVVPMVAEARWA